MLDGFTSLSLFFLLQAWMPLAIAVGIKRTGAGTRMWAEMGEWQIPLKAPMDCWSHVLDAGHLCFSMVQILRSVGQWARAQVINLVVKKQQPATARPPRPEEDEHVKVRGRWKYECWFLVSPLSALVQIATSFDWLFWKSGSVVVVLCGVIIIIGRIKYLNLRPNSCFSDLIYTNTAALITIWTCPACRLHVLLITACALHVIC